MRQSGFRVGPKAIDGCPYKKKREWKDAQGEESNVKMVEEVGVLQAQAKEC